MGEPRGYLMDRRKRIPLDGKVHLLFWHWSDKWPGWRIGMWPWRPLCWIDGQHKPHYGSCVICGKAL